MCVMQNSSSVDLTQASGFVVRPANNYTTEVQLDVLIIHPTANIIQYYI